jgi:hypothetical protein
LANIYEDEDPCRKEDLFFPMKKKKEKRKKKWSLDLKILF